jgi:hypothetical protein
LEPENDDSMEAKGEAPDTRQGLSNRTTFVGSERRGTAKGSAAAQSETHADSPKIAKTGRAQGPSGSARSACSRQASVSTSASCRAPFKAVVANTFQTAVVS